MKHKTILKIMSLAIALTTAFTTVLTATTVKAETKVKKTALQSTVDAMQPGWNLGNTLDAYTGDETSWGNPLTTKALIQQIAANGYKSIRVPITWQQRTESAPDYKINEQFLARVKEIVDWSLDARLYVIIDLHHDSGWVSKMETDHDKVLAKFNASWTQISNYFKDYSNKLMFESINEPRFSDDWNKDDPKYFEMLDELNTSFFGIVRKSGGKNDIRPLVLPTITCSTSQNRLDELNKTITKLNDKNIIATFHYYGYWPFSVNIAGSTTFNADVKNDLVQTFDRVYDSFVAKGIPVIAGEYGLLGFDKSLGTIEHGEILKYFEYINYYAKQKDIPLMLWDNGQHFNRLTFKWSDQYLYNVMKAGWKGRSSNAETDSIYIKKDTELKDIKIQFNLNGNKLDNVKNGTKTLVKGTDYDTNNGVLTIKSSLLKSIVTKNLGKNATLTCTFSKGANWDINVIYYDTPILASSIGTDSGLSIPTTFNGDSLATMEATYVTGGNAGPNNWTAYKEFGSTFSPLYDSNEIKLTTEFLKEVIDGEVLLKMHFWSGEIIDYTITKEGSKIVGLVSRDKVSGY